MTNFKIVTDNKEYTAEQGKQNPKKKKKKYPDCKKKAAFSLYDDDLNF